MVNFQEEILSRKTDRLCSPYGQALVNLLATPERVSELQSESQDWPSWDMTPRQFCDLDLLMNGGFSPLRGFLTAWSSGV